MLITYFTITIGLNRYITTCQPILNKESFTRKCMLSLAWFGLALVFLITLPYCGIIWIITFCDSDAFNENDSWIIHIIAVHWRMIDKYDGNLILTVIIPFGCLSLLINFTCWKHRSPTASNLQTQTAPLDDEENQKKDIIQVFFAVTLVFIVCNSPFAIIQILILVFDWR